MPAMGTPSSSTGAALIAGVFVSIKGVCETTAGLVLCGNVLVRDTGEIGMDVVVALVGGEIGGGEAMSVYASDSVCLGFCMSRIKVDLGNRS